MATLTPQHMVYMYLGPVLIVKLINIIIHVYILFVLILISLVELLKYYRSIMSDVSASIEYMSVGTNSYFYVST